MWPLLECANLLVGRDAQKQETLTGQQGAGGAPSALSDADWSGDGRSDKEEPPLGWGVRGDGTAARWASLSVGGAGIQAGLATEEMTLRVLC